MAAIIAPIVARDEAESMLIKSANRTIQVRPTLSDTVCSDPTEPKPKPTQPNPNPNWAWVDKIRTHPRLTWPKAARTLTSMETRSWSNPIIMNQSGMGTTKRTYRLILECHSN